jgi:hypothetical protein
VAAPAATGLGDAQYQDGVQQASRRIVHSDHPEEVICASAKYWLVALIGGGLVPAKEIGYRRRIRILVQPVEGRNGAG